MNERDEQHYCQDCGTLMEHGNAPYMWVCPKDGTVLFTRIVGGYSEIRGDFWISKDKEDKPEPQE